MFRAFTCVVLTGILAAQQPSNPEAMKPPEGWTALVRAELTADVVLRGRMHIKDAAAFDEAMQRGGGYAPMTLEVNERIRGGSARNIEFTCFIVPSVAAQGIHPTGEELLELDRREVVVMLEGVGRRMFLSDRIRGEALGAATDARLREVREIVERNAVLAKTPIPADVPFTDDVLDILDEITRSPDLQQEGFWKIQEFGSAALPAVAACLADDRKIESESLEIRAHAAQDGSGRARIMVETYGEALGVIANEWAGESFGIAHDVVDRRNRARRIELFRVFAHYVLADQSSKAVASRKSVSQRISR